MPLPERWEPKKWGDLATLEYGKGVRGYTKERVAPYPVYGTNGPIGWHDEFLYPKEGVIVGRKGAYRGIHFSSLPFFVIDTAFYLQPLVDGDFDIKWAYYQLLNFDINKLDSGSAIPSTSREAFYEIPVAVPPLPTQRKIASILSAYDDLIENNLRRIQILEEMAQNLYREWFVNFRFPGHESVRMVDSELGEIPEGWSMATVKDVSNNFDRLRKPLSKMQRAERPGPYPYYGAAKVFDHIDDYIFDGVYLLVAEDGSVITSDRRPVLQYVSGKFWPNNHTHILQGVEPISTEFLYFALNEVDITGYITGAAQPKITQTNLNRIPTVIPKRDILDRFNSFAGEVMRRVILCRETVSNLRDTRDILLPRLISGELDVSDLDIALPEEAA